MAAAIIRLVSVNDRNRWQMAVSDVNDPKNLGSGDINTWSVVWGIGIRDVFNKIGGANIHVQRIGSAPAKVE